MSDPLLWALLAFAFTTSGTPGPNNAMLTASGANFGFRRAVPHMLGIIIGFPAMVLAIGLGLGAVFAALPWLHLALKYVGTAYMLYLAWRIATAGRGKGLRPRVWQRPSCSLVSFPQYSGVVSVWRLAGCLPPIALFGFSTMAWPWH